METTCRAVDGTGPEECDGLFWFQTRDSREPTGTVVEWLWDAGAASGVCPDRDTAVEHVEMFAAPETEAWVEKAILVASAHAGLIWLRTGTVHVGRPGRNGTRQWSQTLLGLPPESTCRD